MLTGVYSITCVANGRRYIGSAIDIARRLGRHLSELRHGKHYNVHIQRAWDKYGEDAFRFEPILETDPDAMRIWEKRIIDNVRPAFNVKGTDPEKNLYSHSDESKAKMSAAKKGHKVSAETRAKMSARMISNKFAADRKHTPEEKANISAVHKGNKYALGYRHTDEAKAKISAAGMGNKNGLGYKHTPEAIEKIRAASIGRLHSRKRKPKVLDELAERVGAEKAVAVPHPNGAEKVLA